MLAFEPVNDEQVIFSNYTQQTIDEAIADMPVIIGTTSNEGAAINVFDLSGPNETAAESYLHKREIPSQVMNLTIATASTQAQMISMCSG
ncbi:hypothetical protein BFW01_g12851 [Lasiodiplodia theobromae]|nr:hypothetical protein BFW01_g12851 [Lasiodiplodia theobromae]